MRHGKVDGAKRATPDDLDRADARVEEGEGVARRRRAQLTSVAVRAGGGDLGARGRARVADGTQQREELKPL